MRRRSFLVALVFSTLSFLASAESAFAKSTMSEVFASTFRTTYVANQCGTNIMNLVKQASQAGVDVSNASIVQITNKGNFNFGMVGAFQAREEGPRYQTPVNGFKFAPGLTSWYFHVVLEQDGLIFDYDFGNEPLVLPAAAYFEAMLLPEQKWQMGSKITPRAERLAQYQVSIFPAADSLSGQRSKPTDVSLETYLQ